MRGVIRHRYDAPPREGVAAQRATGLSTAFVGSSNLSHSAQIDGIEWNVRLAQAESPALLESFRTVFETYWESEQFEAYEPGASRQRAQPRARAVARPADEISPVQHHPYPHQRRILDDLEHRATATRPLAKNLVVAATGTGKTVVARTRLRAAAGRLGARWHPRPSLLSWHTERRSSRQSMVTFRARAGAMAISGKCCVGGATP